MAKIGRCMHWKDIQAMRAALLYPADKAGNAKQPRKCLPIFLPFRPSFTVREKPITHPRQHGRDAWPDPCREPPKRLLDNTMNGRDRDPAMHGNSEDFHAESASVSHDETIPVPVAPSPRFARHDAPERLKFRKFLIAIAVAAKQTYFGFAFGVHWNRPFRMSMSPPGSRIPAGSLCGRVRRRLCARWIGAETQCRRLARFPAIARFASRS